KSATALRCAALRCAADARLATLTLRAALLPGLLGRERRLLVTRARIRHGIGVQVPHAAMETGRLVHGHPSHAPVAVHDVDDERRVRRQGLAYVVREHRAVR